MTLGLTLCRVQPPWGLWGHKRAYKHVRLSESCPGTGLDRIECVTDGDRGGSPFIIIITVYNNRKFHVLYRLPYK